MDPSGQQHVAARVGPYRGWRKAVYKGCRRAGFCPAGLGLAGDPQAAMESRPTEPVLEPGPGQWVAQAFFNFPAS